MLLSKKLFIVIFYCLLGGRDLRGTKNAPKNVEPHFVATGYSCSRDVLPASHSTAKLGPNFHESMSNGSPVSSDLGDEKHGV